MLLASLDSETLSLDRLRCVVHDVGIVIYDTERKSKSERNTKTAHGIRLNIMEQILAGRTLDAKTVGFHEKNFGDADLFRQHLETPPVTYQSMTVARGLHRIKELLEPCQEIWINGVSFDPMVLHSLADDFGFQQPLWYHRKEVDVRSINEQMGTLFKRFMEDGSDSKPVRHEAIEDAQWNMSVACAFRAWRAEYIEHSAPLEPDGIEDPKD